MISPHLTTRSIVALTLLVSVVALIVSLVRGWSTSQHPLVHSALAAAPKTELAHTLITNRDAASAVAYYLSQPPGGVSTYTHPVYGFSFPYLTDFNVQNFQDEHGEIVLVEHSAVGMGFQIFITPDDKTQPLTAARIHHDVPNMAMDEVVEFMLPDDTPAVRFVSHDPVLGDVGETWFRRDGHVFQLSVSAPDRALQDAWIRDIAANLTFAN